jgi:hypothetical protein
MDATNNGLPLPEEAKNDAHVLSEEEKGNEESLYAGSQSSTSSTKSKICPFCQ